MTDIDLKRLAEDREYWDSVASKSANFAVCNNKKFIGWQQYEFGDEKELNHRLIPRPIKQECQEMLPPVGWHGECTWGTRVDWCECVILSENLAAVETSHHGNCWELHPINDYVFRPLESKQPTKQEWDGVGLPPVGCECEINPNREWFKATIRGYGKSKFLAEISPNQKDSGGDPISGEFAYWTESTKFRPMRTKQQRARDELREELTRVIRESDDMAFSFSPDDIADAVINFYEERYNLEEK